MRGSLRLRHKHACPGAEAGRTKDPRSCTCSPNVVGRVSVITRALGYLPRG